MTGGKLYLLEPESLGDRWAPYAGVRPIAELRAGAYRIWERWQRLSGAGEVAVLSPETPEFADADSRPLASSNTVIGPAVVARSTFAPSLPGRGWPDAVRTLTSNGTSVAWVLNDGERWDGPRDPAPSAEIPGILLSSAADLVSACDQLLGDDCRYAIADSPARVPSGAIVLGDPGQVLVQSTAIEPMVVFDVRNGPVVIEPEAIVRAGSRLEGPVYIGHHSWVLGGSVKQSSIGPHCRVNGEVSNSVFAGYANKGHDGFLGHSVLGHWVNLGAGTTTSNLKNTYGPVRLELPAGRLETGRTFLGTLFGDHAKTAIGTMLKTGTIVGTGANVVDRDVPRFVLPFQWEGSERLTLDGFLRIAGRVMPRRGVTMTDSIKASLTATYRRICR